MNILKKTLSLIMISITLLCCVKNNVYSIANISNENTVKIGVFLRNSSDHLLSSIEKNLEDIQKENENKVEFTFFDAKDNQLIQDESIDQAINNGFSLLAINLASRNKSQVESILNKVIRNNIPFIIFLSSNSEITNFLRNQKEVVVIDGDEEQGGVLQGKILVKAWNANKKEWDKNGDDIMQYVMFQGPHNSVAAINRTKYSIQTINDSGIKTQQLTSVACNWDEECAQTAMESIFLTKGNKIETIIANNDAMAIGAIKALQKYGYNKGDKLEYIPIIGFNALQESKELIKQGIMTGTVVLDSHEYAKAIYDIGMNFAAANDPLDGTNYKFDETGITIHLPYYEYVNNY